MPSLLPKEAVTKPEGLPLFADEETDTMPFGESSNLLAVGMGQGGTLSSHMNVPTKSPPALSAGSY